MQICNQLNPLYEVSLIQKSNAHFYKIDNDDIWRPGVTGILGVINKPAIPIWSSEQSANYVLKIARKLDGIKTDRLKYNTRFSKLLIKRAKKQPLIKSREASNIGTQVHKTIDSIISGEEIEIHQDIKPAVDGFLSWRNSNSLKIMLGDTKIASRIYGFGGSLDMVAFDNNQAVIFDFKTTKKRKDRSHGIYNEFAYQLAAYKIAFQETFGISVKALYALWLNKEKPEFEAVRINNHEMCFEAFLGAFKLYQMQKFNILDDF